MAGLLYATMSQWLSWILVIHTLSIPKAAGQRGPIQNFCRRFGHQTAIVDYLGQQRLYIDGGLLNWEAQPENYTNPWLLYQDLDSVGPDGMPNLYANLSKNSSIPNVSGGVLWADNVNKKFYAYGGDYFQESPSTSFVLYAYDIIYDYWVSLGPPQQPGISSVSYGAGVAISDRGEGYYYGGWLSNSSIPGWSGPPVATANMVKYDMDENTWTNLTGPDMTRRAEGAVLSIPAGDGGMLLYLGGVVDPYLNGTVGEQSMKSVFVYDVLSSKWYTQTASGSIPDARRRFCAGVAWPPDQSSYNIYLYGGAGFPPNTAGFDDLYVLSIPSFTWIKLWPPPDGDTTGRPHHSLSCNVLPGGGQMLIIGGTFPLNSDCDVPQQWGTHNVDLGQQNSEHAWWQLFSPNKTTYAVPAPLRSATGTAPAAGWAHPDLPTLLSRKATAPASRTPTRPIPTPTTSPQGTPSLPPGAIAGIAVGAALALAAAAAALCCAARRLRARQTYPPVPASSTAHSRTGPASFAASSPAWSPQDELAAGAGAGAAERSPLALPWLAQGRGAAPVELAAAAGEASPVGRGGGSVSGTGTGVGAAPGVGGGGGVPPLKVNGVWLAQAPAPQELSPDPAADGTAGEAALEDWNGRAHQTYYHP